MLKILMFLLLSVYIHAGLTDFKTIEEARKAYEAKEYAKSVTLLNSLEAKSPQKQYDIGNALYKDKKYDEAIKAYEKAAGVDEATRLHNLGNSHFQKKELDKSIKSYEKALKLKEDEDTKFNLELAKKQKKKEEEQKKQEEKNKDKKDDKKNDDKKDQDKKDDEKKKQDKKEKENDDKKKEKEKKEGKKDKNDSKKEKKPQDKKGDKDSNTPKEQKKSKEDKLKEQELKRLMKKMESKKIPTMMYQMDEGKKGQRSEDAKPW